MQVNDYIQQLQLLPHPEGGYYKETYRSESLTNFEGFEGPRNYCTGIYFLIEKNNFSALHRIQSDEMWHFYAGDALEVIEITPQGKLIVTKVGNNLTNGDVFQYTVKAGHWFGSRVKQGGEFSLVGCTVAPGFDFRDFEMADRNEILQLFPEHKDLIIEMTRVNL